jgi:hypothetical protein
MGMKMLHMRRVDRRINYNAVLGTNKGFRVPSNKDLSCKHKGKFLISNFRRVLYVVCFLLGDPPASEFYKPTFRNTLSVPSS